MTAQIAQLRLSHLNGLAQTNGLQLPALHKAHAPGHSRRLFCRSPNIATPRFQGNNSSCQTIKYTIKWHLHSWSTCYSCAGWSQKYLRDTIVCTKDCKLLGMFICKTGQACRPASCQVGCLSCPRLIVSAIFSGSACSNGQYLFFWTFRGAALDACLREAEPPQRSRYNSAMETPNDKHDQLHDMPSPSAIETPEALFDVHGRTPELLAKRQNGRRGSATHSEPPAHWA